jgi:Cys-rich protein (TIGR01571 family)
MLGYVMSVSTFVNTLFTENAGGAKDAFMRRLQSTTSDCDEDCVRQLTMIAIATSLVIIIITEVIWWIIACMYKQKVTDQRTPFEGNGSQKDLEVLEPGKLFDCCFDMHLCLHACCCVAIRAADTFDGAGKIVSFWCVIGVFFLEWLLYNIVAFIINAYILADSNNSGNGLAWFITNSLFAIWYAMKRQELRQKFGGSPKMAMDCICYWWCFPCSVGQDALLLDKATGVSVQCCCNMIKNGPTPAPAVATVVGVPVAVASNA